MADKSYSGYLSSGYYQSTNILVLQEQLAQYATDEATLRSQAEAALKPTYDAQKLSYEQERDTSVLGYQNQLNELLSTREADERKLHENYASSANDLNNQLLKRGLGRSSLVATQGVALQNQRNTALAELGKEYSAKANSVQETIAQVNRQAADSIQQLDSSYAQQLQAKMDELKQTNLTAATQLQLQIAELQYNGYLAYMAAQQAASSRRSSGRSSSRYYGGSGSNNPGAAGLEVNDYNLQGGVGSAAGKAVNAALGKSNGKVGSSGATSYILIPGSKDKASGKMLM